MAPKHRKLMRIGHYIGIPLLAAGWGGWMWAVVIFAVLITAPTWFDLFFRSD